MKHKTGFSFSVILAFALAVVGCSLQLPAQTVPSPATSTPDNPFTQTLTAAPAASATPPPPSETPTGTSTLYPTITPIPSDTPIPSNTPKGAGPTPTPQYACQLIDKYPDNWMEIRAHTAFEARWTIKNTGTISWRPVRVVLRYISGVKMYVGDEKQDLTTETIPDSLLLLIVDMISPKVKGDYTTVWGLVEARTGVTFCSFTAKIIVK